MKSYLRSLRVAEPLPLLTSGKSLIPQSKNIAVVHSGSLNYVEFRAAMHPMWCMAERVGVEPTIPLLAEYTISNRAPSASRASLHNFALAKYF